MSELLTCVEIAFYPEFQNHWLRFGEADEWRDLDRRRALAFFKPGRVFGYVRWLANEYGTLEWRISLVQTIQPQGGSSRILSKIPGVSPGGEVLLLVTGNTRVKQALLLVDEIEAMGIDPEQVSPAYYRHVHNRITAGKPIRPYSYAQHEAHLAAKRAGR